MAVVQKGDSISLAPDGAESTKIKWQQNFAQRSKVFNVIPFTVKGSGASGTLFLENGLAEEFLKLCEKDESANPLSASGGYTIQVTDVMQYGQDDADDPKVRFLVYHDKSDNIYQHRFMQTTAFGNVMEKVSDVAGNIPGLGDVMKKVAGYTKAFVGDSLRSF